MKILVRRREKKKERCEAFFIQYFHFYIFTVSVIYLCPSDEIPEKDNLIHVANMVYSQKSNHIKNIKSIVDMFTMLFSGGRL